MLNKRLIIEMLNYDVVKYQYYHNLYEKAEDPIEHELQWNNMYRYSSSLEARKQMCTAFGYKLVYNGEIIVDILPS